LGFDTVADTLEGPCDRIFLVTGVDGFLAFAEGLVALAAAGLAGFFGFS
jgi:hypothetical protein